MRQYARPLLIDRLEGIETARLLERQPLTSKEHDERWLQERLYRFPELLPVDEIEPGFGSLVPVCLELPTAAGRIDNLFITETGNLAIAECKLWRNPEARREVVAQIIDYAQSMAQWDYEELESKIRSAKRLNEDSDNGGLFSLVKKDVEEDELDETQFVDAVSRNLRLGRVLLLLVGDGIREGVETLTDYLQMHAGFHFTLGIVEMAVFKLASHGVLVQPRVLARTVNIPRAIVRLDEGRIRVDALPKEASVQPTSISQDRLIEMLQATAPETVKALNTFREKATPLGVFVEPAPKTLQFRWRGPDDEDYWLGGITPNGELRTMQVNYKPYQIGKVDLAHEYLAKIATLMGKSVHRGAHPKGWRVLDEHAQRPKAIELLSHPDEWLEIIRWYTNELSEAIEAENSQ